MEFTTIVSFILLSSLCVNNNSSASFAINNYSEQTTIFQKFGVSHEPTKLIDNNDGYTYRLCDIYKSSFTNYSDLYIVREQIWITPGRIAKMENSKYSDVQLGKGLVSIELQEYFENDNKHGGHIKTKAWWPQSSQVNVSLSSSYSDSYSNSFTSSVSGGASLGAGSVGASISSSNSSTSTTAYSFSCTDVISYVEPLMSSQLSSSSNKKVYWTYEYPNAENHGLVTLYLDLYIMFEMDKNYVNCGSSAFKFVLTVETTDVYYEGNIFMGRGWKYGTKYSNSILNDCFLEP